MANKLISLGNLTRYHQKLLENYDARVMARAPDTGSNPDDAAYLQALFAKGRVILRPNAHYHIKNVIVLPAGTDVEMNGATIEYTGLGFSKDDRRSGCAFLNVNNPNPASASDPDRSITAYNGRGNMRFKNGTFLNCAFGFLHAHDVVFEDCTFGEISTNGHIFQLAACKNVSFIRCTFHGVSLAQDNTYGNTENDVSTEVINLDLATQDYANESGQFIDYWFIPPVNGTKAATWDEYACRDITVDGCVFRPNNNSVYSDAIGYHANFMQPYKDEVSPDPDKGKQFHKCIRVVNNYIYGVGPKTSGNTRSTVAFKVRHMMNSIFANNACENIQALAEIDHVRQVTISGNVVQKNSNNANAITVKSTWHTWPTGTVPKPTDSSIMGYNTVSKHMNIAGNSYGKATITFDASNTNIYNKSAWGPNTSAYPRYSKEGATITLHGRVKPKQSITFNAENEVMTLPEECRPATTVAWVSKGDTYASTNVSFPLLVKVTSAGVVSFTPIGNSVSLTTESDIWIDGTYVM